MEPHPERRVWPPPRNQTREIQTMYVLSSLHTQPHPLDHGIRARIDELCPAYSLTDVSESAFASIGRTPSPQPIANLAALHPSSSEAFVPGQQGSSSGPLGTSPVVQPNSTTPVDDGHIPNGSSSNTHSKRERED